MENYILYIAIASATIASPGPGVVLTISNAIRYGFVGSASGIVGVASAMLCIAVISATSLAAVLSASATAFIILKYVGAAYLIYLGIRMWIQCKQPKFNRHVKIEARAMHSMVCYLNKSQYPSSR